MPVIAVREFICSLCQQPFTLLSGDLILPGPYFCDDCLRAVWNLDDEELKNFISNRLESHDAEQSFVDNIMQHIKGFKEHGEAVEDLIHFREQQRGLFN